MTSGRKTAEQVLRTEAEAILCLIERLDERFDHAVDLIVKGTGRVVVSGMGKSGLVGKKIAATLASTGTPSYFLHPAEALHGDLGMVVAGDVVLALSHSGETAEILRLLELVNRLDVRIIALVGRGDSTLAETADIALDCGVEREACPLGLAPTASTTAALAMGDALALVVSQERGFTAEDFALRHPGGQLAKRLLRVRDLMADGEHLPRIHVGARMTEAVEEMTRGGRGITTVVDDEGRLLGVITDGDLRRLLLRGLAPADLAVDGNYTPGARTITRDETAARALAVLEENQLTSLVVVDSDNCVQGLLHLHHLWRVEMI